MPFKVGDRLHYVGVYGKDDDDTVYTVSHTDDKNFRITWSGSTNGVTYSHGSSYYFNLTKEAAVKEATVQEDTWFTVSDDAEATALMKYADRLGIEYKTKSVVFFREVKQENK